jgi:hypothetical protein
MLRGYFGFAISGSPRRFAARDEVRRCYVKPSLIRGIAGVIINPVFSLLLLI